MEAWRDQLPDPDPSPRGKQLVRLDLLEAVIVGHSEGEVTLHGHHRHVEASADGDRTDPALATELGLAEEEAARRHHRHGYPHRGPAVGGSCRYSPSPEIALDVPERRQRPLYVHRQAYRGTHADGRDVDVPAEVVLVQEGVAPLGAGATPMVPTAGSTGTDSVFRSKRKAT